MTKDHHVITALAIAPGDGRRIYALTDFHPAIWVTRDAGKTWTSGWSAGSFANSPLNPGALAVSPVDANVVYWGRSSGLYVSRDGGKTGGLVGAFRPEWGVNRIAIDSSRPSRLFVATNNGVLVSEDAGASWSRPGGDFPRSVVADLALVKQTLYAATDQGVWSMDLTGRAACEPVTVTPAEPLALGSGGGSERFDVSVAAGCPWTATTGVDWAHFDTGTVSARLDVKSNPGTARHAMLTIADQRIELTQYGGADPIADGAKVTISNSPPVSHFEGRREAEDQRMYGIGRANISVGAPPPPALSAARRGYVRLLGHDGAAAGWPNALSVSVPRRGSPALSVCAACRWNSYGVYDHGAAVP